LRRRILEPAAPDRDAVDSPASDGARPENAMPDSSPPREGAVRHRISDPEATWTPRPLSALSAEDDEADDWDFHGYLRPRTITSLTGLWKAGKTTLVAYLLAALD